MPQTQRRHGPIRLAEDQIKQGLLHPEQLVRDAALRAISPLRVGDEVEVIRMPQEEECGHDVFVTIRWEREGLAVPLSQLKPLQCTDEATRQAIEDWHYWVKQGYCF